MHVVRAFFAVSILHILAFNCSADVTVGNIIVSVNEFTGQANPPVYAAEYSTSGVRLQRFAGLPDPASAPDDRARDLVSNSDQMYLYSGTFSPVISELSPVEPASSWTQTRTFAGWGTVNDTSFGGLARQGNYLFATDMETAGDSTQGIVRFDLSGGPTIRLGTADTEPIDLNTDVSGRVYALSQLSQRTVEVFNPDTGALLDTVQLGNDDWRAIDVASDGTIFAAGWNGTLTRFSSTGALLDSVSFGVANRLTDIDINDSTGQIILGTSGVTGNMILTDLELDTFSTFQVTDSNIGGDVFVSWATAAVPEPGAFSCVALILAGVQFRRRRVA